MGISDRLLGKKNVNGNPRIEGVAPASALPGGEKCGFWAADCAPRSCGGRG